MAKEDEIKIVPPKPLPARAHEDQRKEMPYYRILCVLAGGFVALLAAVSFLPLSGYMKVLSLILGAFLIYDLHHSVKYYVGRQ